MKKSAQLPARILIVMFCTMYQSVKAKWISKASEISSPQRGLVELIAVDNNVVWGVAGSVVDFPNFPNHQLIWNANDENGNAVSSGIYLLRLNTGSYSETKKLSVIK